MDVLRVEGLRAGYGDGPDVLVDVAFRVAPGEVVALLGASGSGKSTLLRSVAGLHPLRAGRVLVGGEDVSGRPVETRGIGLVFQDHALFPHRDVTGNVAFGPRMQGLDAGTVGARVDRALADVGLSGLAHRAIDELSGGEQQRVALARALAAHPRLLLLDEPYGSLDRPLREHLAAELPRLARGDGIGAVLVTHDQQEALRAADRIGVIVSGDLRQLDRPAALWRDPVDAEVAGFLGVGVLLAVDIADGVAHGASGPLPLPAALRSPGGPATLLVPHAAVRLHRTARAGTEPDDTAMLAATAVEVRFAGDHHRLEAQLASGDVVNVRIHDGDELPEPGAPVQLAVRADALRRFPAPARSAGCTSVKPQ